MSIPAGPTIEYARGDTAPFAIVFKQDGQPFNWGGYTEIEATVNPSPEPTDASAQVIQFAGTPRAVDGTDGTVDFEPPNQAASDALVPESYFYDVTAIDGSARKVTILLGGVFVVKQDINKD